MDKRYQVFVSSTYADLKQERQRVIQALMEMDCIPAGMELFPAADEEQWAFIKRVIDDCDYYLIIIGGRYGSMTPEGISYTEKEFDYAHDRGIKIIALLHEDPGSIPVNKSDIDPTVREKLQAFRQKVATNRLVKFWKSADELPGLVALSLSKTIKTHPAVGWVRASSVPTQDMLIETNQLRKENEQLRLTVNGLQSKAVAVLDDIADFDDTFTINGKTRIERHYGGRVRFESDYWTATVTWRKLFSLIAPYLMERPPDAAVHIKLATAVADSANIGGSSRTIDDQEFKTITIQLKALGLISVDYLQTVKGGMALFWSLTPIGERIMMEERIVKKSAK
jgi:hypothetical protein